MTDRCIGWITGRIYESNPKPKGLLFNYPGTQGAWSDLKKDKYLKNITRVFFDNSYDDYLCSFELTVKPGEV